ncbi:MAG: hypothetical protein M1831_003022 [Alyxoria varia]|nr:MAG: hypothetical protein M1831_003022 [Alyxoria varia]
MSDKMPTDGTEGDNLFPGAEGPGMTSTPSASTQPSSTQPSSVQPASTQQPASNSQAGVPSVVANCVQQGDKWIHQPTGYEFTNEAAAPGFKWKNKRAQEEEARAWDSVVDKNNVIGSRYGDVMARFIPKGKEGGK